MSATRQPGAWRPDVPSTLDGRYFIEAEIEALAYGVLYAGRDLAHDEPVAITVFHPAFFDAPHRARNLERLRKTLRYRHPNLAAVRTVVDEHDPVYVVTDPLVGQPLTLWRREGREATATPAVTYRLIGQLLGALADIHTHGIHGAIGPSTVRIAGSDLWLINPWHIEPPADLPPGELPSLRAVWLAPEQLYDVAPEGPATDVYAAGLVLGFLLARGLTEPGHSLMVQGLDVAPPLDEVYVAATARQPELRYANVDELRRALEAAIGPAWGEAQVTLDTPVHARVMAQSAQSTAAGAVFVGAAADAPAAHPSTDDTPFEGIPIMAQTLVDGELDVDRTVEEEAIPAEILDVTATAEALAIPVAASGIVDARELDEALDPPSAPPPLPGAARDGEDEPPVPEVVEVVGVVGVASEPATVEGGGAPPPPLPTDAEWIGPPSPGDTVTSGTPPLPEDADWVGPPGPGDTLTSDEPFLLAQAEKTQPGAGDDDDRLAVAAGGESWILEAHKLSEAVRAGVPIERAITRVPSDRTPPPEALSRAPEAAPGPAPSGPPPSVPPPLPAPSPSGRRARPAAIPAASLTIEVASGSTESVGPRTGPSRRPLSLADVTISRTSPAAAQTPARSEGGRRGLWIAAVAFLVLGGVAAALLFGGDGESNPAPPTRGDAYTASADGGASADVAGGVVVAVADASAPDTITLDTITLDSGAPDTEGGTAAASADGATLATADDAVEAGPDAEADTVADTAAPEDTTATDDTVVPAEDTAPTEDTVAPVADTATVAAADTLPAADTVSAAKDTAAPAAGSSATTFVPTDWRKLRCPGGMAKIRKKLTVTLDSGEKVTDWDVYCIDRYEAPGSGRSPTTDIDFVGAKAACRGAGKRLCSRSEWRRACGGKYPYGRTYDPDACNSVGSDGMPRPVLTSGSKARCKSGWGVYDMVGNVAEWTSDGRVNGGGAYKHGESGTCYQSSRRAGGHPYVGYRCCANAK